MADGLCSVEGCGRTGELKRGWCAMHYLRWRRNGTPEGSGRNYFGGMDEEERFWAYVRKGDGCWEYTGALNAAGYGRFAPRWGSKPKGVLAHRYAMSLHLGYMPSSQVEVCHRCDNPACVRPDHLFLGSQAENIRDMDRKGRRRTKPTVGEAQWAARLTEDDVRSIRHRHAAGEPQTALAAEYGLSVGHVSRIVRRVLWKHVA